MSNTNDSNVYNSWSTHPLYNVANDQRIKQYCPNFQGLCWRLACDWLPVIAPISDPLNYLEIGTLHGANLISVWKEYGKHPNSTFTIIDPYVDYSDYNEFHGEQDRNFLTMQENLLSVGFPVHNLHFYRDFSYNVLPSLTDNFYNLIYIDGNHKPEAVLEDGVLAWRKLQDGSCLVFDDYGWGGDDCTKRGIDAFVSGYRDQISVHTAYNGQYFMNKIY